MDCNTLHKKIADYREGTLLPEEKKHAEEHLTTCEQCRSYAADIRRTIETLNGLEEVPTPPWLTQKVMQRIRAEAQPKKGLFQKLFFPLHIKLPLEAAATLLIAGAAVLIMRSMGPDLQPVTIISEKPLVQTLPSEKGSLSKDKPAIALPKQKAEQTPSPLAEEQAESLSDRSARPAQQPTSVPAVPAAPAPAPVMRGLEAGKARDAAEQDEIQHKAAPGSSRSLLFAEKQSSFVPALTLQVRDTEKASLEIEAVLSKLGGNIKAADKHEVGTTLTIQLEPSKRETFLEQIRRTGRMKETELAPEIFTAIHFYLIIIKQ